MKIVASRALLACSKERITARVDLESRLPVGSSARISSGWLMRARATAELARLGEDALAEVRNKQLGFVFQDFLLLDGLTVRQNILLPAIMATNSPFPT